MMSETEVYEVMQPWLDGQLDAPRRAEVDAFLSTHPDVREIFESERAFGGLLKTKLAQVAVPESLNERLRKSLDGEITSEAPLAAAPNIVQMPRRNWKWQHALAMVAMLFLSVGVGYGIFRYNSECPYMVACAHIHDNAQNNTLMLASNSPDQVCNWAKGQMGIKLTCLPSMREYALQIKGAGEALFQDLQKYGAPKGVYVEYSAAGEEPVTLIIHPWKDEKPMAMNYDAKEKWWRTVHQGSAIVAWKRESDQTLVTLVSHRPLAEILKMSEDVREELEAVVPPSKTVQLELLGPAPYAPMQSPELKTISF